MSPDELKIKRIEGIFKQNIKTKCSDKMGEMLIIHKFGQQSYWKYQRISIELRKINYTNID
jgi:hypothetical protein